MNIVVSRKDYEKFFDNLVLANKGEEKFKIEAKSEINCFISFIETKLQEGNNIEIGEVIFKTALEFEKWLYNDVNIQLGTSIINSN